MNNYPYNYGSQGGYPYDTQGGGQFQPQQSPQQPNNNNRRNKKRGIGGVIAGIACGVVAGALVMGYVIMPNLADNKKETAQPAASAVIEETTPAAEEASAEIGGAAITIENKENPVVDIAEAASKSVVSVELYTRSYVSGQQPIDQAVGAGSGFVISDDGLILTNNHVVEGANRIVVVTQDGNEYEAEVLGSDPATEVALLRVEGLNIPALPLGNSDELKVGEQVVAVGNPINDNLTGTVTVGYVSGVNREMDLNDTGITVPMIQTDAAINPGNSGGPLFNTNGEVIGITTMKTVYAGISESGSAIAAEGIGYAVPINTAREVSEYLLENGSVPVPEKPGIGFTYRPVDAQDAQMWGVPQGIMIASVAPGSPAERAGLREYDVIVQLDGVDLANGAEVPSFSDKSVGDTVAAQVWRNGQTYEMEFELVDLNQLG